MSDKYNERVQALAEEMAVSHYLKHPEERAMKYMGFSFSQLPKATQDKLIELKLNDARIAVKQMSIWYQKGCFDMKSVHNTASELRVLRGVIDEKKREYGLFPDSAPEVKPKPCPHELRCHTRNHPEGTCDCHNMGLLPEESPDPNATIDRTNEHAEDPEIVVTLSNGHVVKFWITGLIDAEYIRRAIEIQKIEKAQEGGQNDKAD